MARYCDAGTCIAKATRVRSYSTNLGEACTKASCADERHQIDLEIQVKAERLEFKGPWRELPLPAEKI